MGTDTTENGATENSTDKNKVENGMAESNNWVCVLEDSSQLKPLQIMEWVESNPAAGRPPKEVVVWRSESGEVCAMEPRCPHQWSHLGNEGLVVGEEMICVTHFWAFEKNGCGWKENEAGRRDRKSDIEVFPCKEEDGGIFVQL